MRNVKILALIAVLTLFAAGCGDSAEERLVEEMIERSGGDVSDIDINSGGDDFDMTIEGEDGETISVSGSGDDDDFTMVIEGEDGEVMTFGSGEIPEGLTVPIPDGGSVTSSLQAQGQMSVSLEYDQSRFDELVASYDSVMKGDDVDRFESTSSAGDDTIRTVSWSANSGNTFVSVSDCYSMSSGEMDAACVTVYQYEE